MTIDYLKESEKYRPEIIKTLLIGEAPPHSGQTYFYLPTSLSNANTIRNDRTLPATIFCHYFGQRPQGQYEYTEFLNRLKEVGIFLVDIYDQPIKVRGSPEGERQIIEAIPKLRNKLLNRGIKIHERSTIFLLARNSYTKHIKKYFPNAERIPWIKFRMANIDNATMG